MKKVWRKFITILILSVMAFEIVLPTNIAATDWEEFEKNKFGKDTYMMGSTMIKARTFDRTGWYRESTNDYFAEDSIFYFNASGDKLYPDRKEKRDLEFDTRLHSTEVYLIKGTVYYMNADLNPNFNSEGGILDELEALLADFVYGIASALHWLVGKALGETVNIDMLVFNNYEETNISFFASDASGHSTLIYGDGNVSGLNTVISDWYGIFMKIALMGYMVILVYMGVRIMLTPAADKKANYKKLFTDWVIGLAILFLFPYAMKYMIKANEAIVEVIEANKGYDDSLAGEIASDTINVDKNLADAVANYAIDWSKGTDYMSKLADVAYQTQKLALSFAFLIMTWQLVALIFHYYKRLFMLAFLIVIFPLVAFSYAIDKIADGKSQAFNTWAKEFMINVFVQSFHAIVYVFCCSTVYSASGMGGSIEFDYILIIVGVSFLFEGENIIRSIFGQVSKAGTMGSLVDAAATVAKTKMALKAVKAVGSYTVGEKSVVNKLKRGSMEIRAINKRLNAFDKTSTTPQEYNPGMRLPHMSDIPKATESGEEPTDDQKKNFLKEREYFNAAAVFDNPNSHSYAEKAMAQETLKELAKENPHHKVFNDTKETAGQFAAIADLDYDVQRMLSSGMSRVDIERQVTARLGIIFAGESEEKQKDRVNTYFTNLYIKGSSSSVTLNSVKREIDDIIEEVNNIQKSIVFADADAILSADEIDTRNEIYNQTADDADEIFGNVEDMVSDSEKSITKEYAKNIAILKQRGSGVYTQSDILAAANYLRKHSHENEAITQMMEDDFGMDVDMFIHSLARKITDEPEAAPSGSTSAPAPVSPANKAARDTARAIVNDYERDPRLGYYDDQISVHQVIKEKNNQDELDRILDETYQTRRQAMKEATTDVAKEYLVDNKIKMTEGGQDTTVRTQAGDTREELLVKRIEVYGKTLSNLAAVNKESASEESYGAIWGAIAKGYLAHKETQRTGIRRSWKEMKDVLNPVKTTKEYMNERQEERAKIDDAHFYGDIGDRSEKK